MKKRICLAICLSMLSINAICPMALATNPLNVSGFQQEKSMWCWASCCRSIINYCTTASPSQSDIVTYIHGSSGNYGGSVSQKSQALDHWNVTHSIQNQSLTYNGVKSQIDNDHPIIAVLQEWYGTGVYHDNVIRGYNDSYTGVLFICPYDGNYHGQNYDDYRSGRHYDGKSYNWLKSIFDCD